MKFLFVSTELPYPLNSGGRVAIYHRMKALKELGHQVDFCFPYIGVLDQSHMREVRKVCNNVRGFGLTKFMSILNMIIYPRLPFRASRRLSLDLIKHIKKNISNYDVFMVEHSSMDIYKCIDYSEIYKILFFHSLSHKSLSRVVLHLPKSNLLKRAIYSIESIKTKWSENRIFNNDYYSNYWFYSKDDINDVVDEFPELRKKIKLIPLSVSDAYDNIFDNTFDMPLVYKKIDPDRIVLLIGSMDNPSNEDAARWFADQIFPRILKCEKNTHFVIIGKNSDNKLNDISNDNITVVGEVEHLEPYLKYCSVYIVPQRGGAGVRVKLMVGLSSKKPVVSTSVGVEALNDIVPGKHFLLADTDLEFSDSVVDILQNRDNYAKLSEDGYLLFKDKYSEKAVGQYVLNYINNDMVVK
jgi:polysaccharide biosynthesis protein PslH